ncbi:pheromone-regulated protein prm10 [Coemansia sp. Benny D115]|nr:pheromone-regulated protein prm10 [Coemansia sp. Benny D115]
MAVHSKADLDVPPRVLESNDFQNNSDNNNKVHKEQQQQQQAVATSNFDANYIATMGKDNQSIAIRVDSRKRARDLLRRLEGRTESGGILGNLIRLQNTMAGGGGGTQETKKPIKRPLPAAKALAIEGHRSWTSLSGMLRPFTRSKSTDKLHTLHSQGTTTTKQSDQERPVGSPNVLSGAAGADGLPRSFSSARVSALMMTPGALAKNGVIPPPSTHGSLMRSDKRFSSGYFDYYGSPTASPLQSPSLTANHQGSAETTPLLSEEQAELVDRIAGILEKQDFLMHLARAWHAFGSPVHRMEANLLEVSRYLDIDACFFTVPGLTLISFGDPDTHSSETHIVRASDGYDMYRLERANRISRDLRKGRMTVHESLRAIEALLAAPCVYDWYIRVGICFIQSFFVSMTLFYGSWKEALVSGGLGLVVGASELLGERYLMLGYLLNVLPPLVVALVTALLSNWVCFAAVPMAATINLLPGLGLVLSMVELSSGNVICGAVRLVSATMTSFMIGWGTIVGHNLGMAAVGREQSTEIASFSSCAATPMSMWWWFLFVPLSTMGFSIWFRVHWRQWPATIVATALGLVIQSFCDRVHVMRPISPGIASFAVGVFGNLYGRLFHCTTNAAFVFVGIMQLVPGSTGVRGFISLLSEDSSASSLTMTMLSTAISIAVGLLLSNGALYYSELKRFKLGTL